jgi:hypothetical protein
MNPDNTRASSIARQARSINVEFEAVFADFCIFDIPSDFNARRQISTSRRLASRWRLQNNASQARKHKAECVDSEHGMSSPSGRSDQLQIIEPKMPTRKKRRRRLRSL